MQDPDDVRFQQLPGGAWRVLDARLPSKDIQALLGFVEAVRDRLFVTLLDDPGHTHPCTNMDCARALILDASQRTGHSQGPLAAPR